MDAFINTITQYLTTILVALSMATPTILAITTFIKSLKGEKRVKQEMTTFWNTLVDETSERYRELSQATKITREGIVQAFKDTVITKDLKVSINTQVRKILADGLDEFKLEIARREAQRTRLTYWAVRILAWTAAAGKLTPEQQSEVNELLALIAEDERVVDVYLEPDSYEH